MSCYNIALHHEQPLFQYPDEGFSEYIGNAVGRLKPVCANCHRMLHRSRKGMTIEELKALLQK